MRGIPERRLVRWNVRMRIPRETPRVNRDGPRRHRALAPRRHSLMEIVPWTGVVHAVVAGHGVGRPKPHARAGCCKIGQLVRERHRGRHVGRGRLGCLVVAARRKGQYGGAHFFSARRRGWVGPSASWLGPAEAECYQDEDQAQGHTGDDAANDGACVTVGAAIRLLGVGGISGRRGGGGGHAWAGGWHADGVVKDGQCHTGGLGTSKDAVSRQVLVLQSHTVRTLRVGTTRWNFFRFLSASNSSPRGQTKGCHLLAKAD